MQIQNVDIRMKWHIRGQGICEHIASLTHVSSSPAATARLVKKAT
jgi:hypothetical protein